MKRPFVIFRTVTYDGTLVFMQPIESNELGWWQVASGMMFWPVVGVLR